MSIRENPRPIAVPAAPPSIPVSLDISLIKQEPKTSWCWVACAAMVLTYRKVSFRMCCFPVHVGAAAKPDCCNNRGLGGGACDQPASGDQITYLYDGIFHIHVMLVVGTISPDDIITEINNDSPVEIGYRSPAFDKDKFGHVVLVYGHDGSGNFFVHNPLYESFATQTLGQLTNPSNGTQWTATWKNLNKPTEVGPNDC